MELMPVADFAGSRNWGYDGVAPFAPARCYGRPDDLRRFVNAAHELGLAVFLDVVYNHLGPDGAYQCSVQPVLLSASAPQPLGRRASTSTVRTARRCATTSSRTRALDYTNIISTACGWMRRTPLSTIALGISWPPSRRPCMHQLPRFGRRVHVIAEDVRNLACMVKPRIGRRMGIGWRLVRRFSSSDARALAGDRDGYFQDFDGTASTHRANRAPEGWFYCGQHAPYFGGPRGTDPAGIRHTQVRLLSPESRSDWQPGVRRPAASCDRSGRVPRRLVLLLLLPETPLLFMGQEWAATTPFLYFTDHNTDLGKNVTEGRRNEFSRFAQFSDPRTCESIPGPQALNI